MKVHKMVQNIYGLILKVERRITLELDHFIVMAYYTLDSMDKANVLNRHFLSIYTTEDTSYLPSLNQHNIPAIEPIIINIAGVAEVPSNIKPFKASGPDNIPAFLLKEMLNKNT